MGFFVFEKKGEKLVNCLFVRGFEMLQILLKTRRYVENLLNSLWKRCLYLFVK